MKILTKRIIFLEVLRKNMKMLWKPNRGLQISEIEDDMFLVEFGDGRDKKRVMEMSPWSFEKQLILLQEFEGELVPKEIVLKWSPFWVQIYNLPLKSMTRETGLEIGAKLGLVLDIDVPEKGVQWGKFLRVRVRFDVTKKLVRGKRISIEGGESRWVFFKYERLPNFCYRCGKLDHGEKECAEKQCSTNREEEGCMQYGAWLRGEPGRRAGNVQGNAEGASRTNVKQTREETTASLPVKEPVRQEVQEGVGEGHVSGQRTNQRPGQRYNREEKRVACQDEVLNHENGKSYLLQEEGEVGVDMRSLNSLTGTLPSAEIEGVMQWEKTKNKVDDSKPEEKAKHTVVSSEVGLGLSETIPWAEELSSPLAMSFNKDKGWISETLGPTSGHWKRLARQTNKPSPGKRDSPEKLKRSGPVPLQELDPNALNTKRKKGKLHTEEKIDEDKRKVGGEAVAAVQHRRAQ
nr:uncharacterized protein CFP56_74507 [Quercus suber]